MPVLWKFFGKPLLWSHIAPFYNVYLHYSTINFEIQESIGEQGFHKFTGFAKTSTRRPPNP